MIKDFLTLPYSSGLAMVRITASLEAFKALDKRLIDAYWIDCILSKSMRLNQLGL